MGLDRLEPIWRTVVPGVLADAAGADGIVLEVRSPQYQAMGVAPSLAERTVLLRVDQGPRGARLGDVIAKRVRGQAVRHLLESEADPEVPGQLAEVLAERWPVRLDEPLRRGRGWTLSLTVAGFG